MAQATRGVLIDTSVLISHLRGRLSLHSVLRGYDNVYISTVTLYELEYGAVKSGRNSDLAQLKPIFEPMILDLGRAEAERAAHLNGVLARRNQHIGPRDALIAGTALQRQLGLMTSNVNEFRRIPDLNVISPS